MPADTILYNARIATNGVPSFVEAVAVTDGKIIASGSDREIFRLRGPNSRIIDANGRTVIPGLNDSHLHPIRAGLSYSMELRWDGVPSLADALRMLREQADRTPAPQWVRVIEGWTEFQFAERRMPTLDEINAALVWSSVPLFAAELVGMALIVFVVGYFLSNPQLAPDVPWLVGILIGLGLALFGTQSGGRNQLSDYRRRRSG